MKKNLNDLNNILFEQLDRLNNNEILEKNMDREVFRTKAISQIAKDVVSNAKLMLEAKKYIDEQIDFENKMPEVLKIESSPNDVQ